MTSDTIKNYLDNNMSSVLPGLLVSFIVHEDAWRFLVKSYIRFPKKKEKYVMEYRVSKEIFVCQFKELEKITVLSIVKIIIDRINGQMSKIKKDSKV